MLNKCKQTEIVEFEAHLGGGSEKHLRGKRIFNNYLFIRFFPAVKFHPAAGCQYYRLCSAAEKTLNNSVGKRQKQTEWLFSHFFEFNPSSFIAPIREQTTAQQNIYSMQHLRFCCCLLPLILPVFERRLNSLISALVPSSARK